MHASTTVHLEAAYQIIRYLKKSGKGLLYSKRGDLFVEAYIDADWAGSEFGRRSTSGYSMFVGENLVPWRSKKQLVVARSSSLAKFSSMAHGICELLWLRSC